MTAPDAQTWHYGVVARWWADFNLDGPEIDYFRPFVEAGQAALDVACGTGRLLIPYLHAGLDVDWTKDARATLPRPWRERGDRKTAADGTEFELWSRLTELDPLAQTVALEMRAEMRRDGEVLAHDEHVLRMTLYFTREIKLMLEATGFRDVELRAGYRDEPPTADDDFVVFIARK